jgi:hypothetical protein
MLVHGANTEVFGEPATILRILAGAKIKKEKTAAP